MKKLLRIAFITCVFTVTMLVSASATCLGVGTVNVDALRLRASSSTSSDILLTAYAEDRVIVLDSKQEEDGLWYHVNCNLTEGWMCAKYLDLKESMDADLGTGIVNVTLLNFRKSPSKESAVICTLAEGAKVNIVGLEKGWFKVTYNNQTGYVSGEYINLASAPGNNTFGVSDIIIDVNPLSQQLLTYASTLLGCPYVYGGTSPSGFDCSGFVQYVYKHFGITIGRSSDDQYQDGIRIEEDDLQPGDILFWSSSSTATTTHSGIYIGNRQFIHSANGGVTITSMDSLWYSMRYVGAVRVLGVEGY